MQLPTDRPRPRLMTQRGVRRVLDLDPTAIASLRTLARGESATLFMGLLAAYKVLLHRLTGQDDLVVGAPVQDRLHPDAQRLIGVFVNTLVLRTTMDPDLTFREVVRRVRDVCVGAYAHQDVPFEHIVDALQPQRSLSHTPLFQTLFTFQDITNRPTTFADLSLSQVHVPTHDAPTDLLLGVMVGRDRIVGVFDFHADLFAPATMDRFVSAFTTLLADAVRQPDRPIATLELLAPAERTRVIEEFNATAQPQPAARRVETLIADQIARSPERPAVRAGAVAWRYGDLDTRASAIAARLTAAGVVAGDLVVVCLERSADMVATLLGVWRAGAAWVPVDPDYPPDRVAWVLEHSRARVAVVTNATAAALPAGGTPTVNLDVGSPRTDPAPRGPVPGGDALAYVLYTSGSTGRPKGVKITHHAVINFLTAMAGRPGLTADDRLLAVTTLAFDIAVLELLLPLTVGGEVIVADTASARDGTRLAALMARVAPTVMQATPSTWRMLLDAGWRGAPDLRVLCGGEALPATLAAELGPVVRELWNMYGPTETTVWSTCGRVALDDGRVTVGGPIANTRVYVLDSRQQPVPIGIPGEAWIGGAGVTAGYLHAPELTAERVQPDPVLGSAAGPVYRTGDLVRWLPDGRLEHLGRLDRQIKVHGHRVEPGEIEAVL
ncbi:MAG TPA: amino acid adenylation domain-containing protein, partial [Nitriliruptorales bacterium]